LQKLNVTYEIKKLFDKLIKFIRRLNRYYSLTNFYPFLIGIVIKGFFALLFLLTVIFCIDFFLVDINLLVNSIFEKYSPKLLMLVFFISESILGLIPPELFIAWASKSSQPFLYVFILATISYLGGVVSYFIGGYLFLIPFIKRFIEVKISHHIVNLRKWGGFFIVLGALTPVPHSLVSLSSGLIKYNFKQYLIWSLFRYLRFILYAIVIFKIL
jgi:membrane protein YqaA with SNARE-associated domain|tara:strand:- start:666 stop:1307 length:642 start_codon:yes stop_codon:yes gene_type:complete